jgi:hypothetical protein
LLAIMRTILRRNFLRTCCASATLTFPAREIRPASAFVVARHRDLLEVSIMKRILLISVFSLSLFGLAACGSSTSDRTLSGAGIGAGVGLAGGALVGAPLAGAAVGGAVGAGTGALTDEEDIDLGEPVWD